MQGEVKSLGQGAREVRRLGLDSDHWSRAAFLPCGCHVERGEECLWGELETLSSG